MKQQFVHEELFSKRCFSICDILDLLELRGRRTGREYYLHAEDAAWFYVRVRRARR